MVWLLPLLFCCCHKNDGNKKAIAFTFSTTYDSVITSYPNKHYEFSFSINVLTGSITNNAISYTISGLPANVTVSPAAQAVSGTLGGLFDIAIGDVAAGSYKLKLVSNSAAGIQNHNLTLVVLPAVDYAAKLAGFYPGSFDYCTPADTIYHYTSVVSFTTGIPGKVSISNVRIFDTSFTIAATLSNIVSVAPQVIGSYVIWGTGTFTHDNAPYDTLYQMTVYDTIAHGVDTQLCTMHVQH